VVVDYERVVSHDSDLSKEVSDSRSISCINNTCCRIQNDTLTVLLCWIIDMFVYVCMYISSMVFARIEFL